MAVKQLYPNQRPTLNLNFARSKVLDPRITFSRGGCGGTYFGSDGLIKTAAVDEPRFDHDPVTGDCRGLLIEELSTNSMPNSNDFANYTQSPASGLVVTSNAGTAPDGTNAAMLVRPNATHTACAIYKSLGNLGFTTATTSIFVKASGKNWIKYWDPWGAAGVWFNVATGVKGVEDSGITNSSIVPVGNGWFRCSVSSNNAGAYHGTYINVCDADNSLACALNSTDGILVWGEQYEELGFPTSYIPTSGSTCTRNADEAEMTGTNFSSWFSGSVTMVISAETLGPIDSFERVVDFIHPGQYKPSRIRRKGSDSTWGWSRGSAPAFILGVSGVTSKVVLIGAQANYGDTFVAVNGNTNAGNSGQDKTSESTSLDFNGAGKYLKYFAYYPIPLTDSQLEELAR